MEASKVILSEAERQLITDANIILTKNSSIDKICEQFGLLASIYQQQCEPLKKEFPQLFSVHPKISKGEKHSGLPWVVLDYPRSFEKQNGQLAIRTFFWWGNYFSIQLQVSGIYMPGFIKALAAGKFQKKDWLLGFTDDAWDLELPNKKWLQADAENISTENKDEIVLKIAKKIPIHEWENLESLFSEAYSELVMLMTTALSSQPVK